jgi:hypothetical protein
MLSCYFNTLKQLMGMQDLTTLATNFCFYSWSWSLKYPRGVIDFILTPYKSQSVIERFSRFQMASRSTFSAIFSNLSLFYTLFYLSICGQVPGNASLIITMPNTVFWEKKSQSNGKGLVRVRFCGVKPIMFVTLFFYHFRLFSNYIFTIWNIHAIKQHSLLTFI